MVKLPDWMRREFAEHGPDTDRLQRETLVVRVAERMPAEDGALTRAVLRNFVRTQFGRWVKQQTAISSDPDLDQPGLFPELPRVLEIGPGRFARIGVMTGTDWDRALKQAQTKASNAGSHHETIRAAYDKIRPLLTGELTTADVAEQIEADAADLAADA